LLFPDGERILDMGEVWIARELIRPAEVADPRGRQIRMHLRLYLQRSAPWSSSRQQACTRTNAIGQPLHVPEVFPANVVRPHIKMVGARINRQAGDGLW